MFKEISNKYKEAFELFLKYMSDIKRENSYFDYDESEDCFDCSCGHDCAENIPFSMLYGLLEDFLDEHKIDLTKLFCEIYYMPMSMRIEKISRDEVRKQATLKAFKVLNERLVKDND